MLRIINITTRYYINSTLYRYTIYTFLAFLEKDQNRQRFILELVNSNNSFEARWIRLFFTLPHLYPHRSLSTRFVSSSFNKQLTTWKKRNANGEKREPRSRSYRSDPRIYDTRLFRNREEKRGYPPRGGVATRQIGFAFGGTPVYFIGYVRYIDQNGALLSELWKKFEMKRSLWKKITQRILFFQLARKKLYAIELWNWKELKVRATWGSKVN